ncbi:peroxiredoxin family protein [Corynebacterium sp. A21]|uniref:peroxiredoxin family protein n=1 Tax=Corynebacterium sp. A21 TaxID=3457318 RepID=UPI003FCFD57F
MYNTTVEVAGMSEAVNTPDAPLFELQVQEWLGHPGLDMADLRGKVVLIEVFQMLCPGCVNHGIPQAKRVHQMMDPQQVQVIGLHSVFEHHEVMTPAALRVFLSEFGVRFPVAVDLPREGHRIPTTMNAYRLQGTPSLILVDRSGRLRQIQFGQVDDLTLGVLLGTLIAEQP